MVRAAHPEGARRTHEHEGPTSSRPAAFTLSDFSVSVQILAALGVVALVAAVVVLVSDTGLRTHRRHGRRPVHAQRAGHLPGRRDEVPDGARPLQRGERRLRLRPGGSQGLQQRQGRRPRRDRHDRPEVHRSSRAQRRAAGHPAGHPRRRRRVRGRDRPHRRARGRRQDRTSGRRSSPRRSHPLGKQVAGEIDQISQLQIEDSAAAADAVTASSTADPPVRGSAWACWGSWPRSGSRCSWQPR